MRAGILALMLLMLFLTIGCGRPEKVESQIIPYREQSNIKPYAEIPIVSTEPDPDGIKFDGIGFGADGAYIMVGFQVPIEKIQLVQPGFVIVIDETSEIVYKDVPVMPVVGPLIGRPTHENQGGYIMLLNYNGGIKSGSVVSVVIGNYKRVHITFP
jgi:hypothetical protein